MNYNVLVLEDDITCRRIIVNLLKSLGIDNVFEAIDGMSGLEISYNYRPSLIICDINMTPMSGDVFVNNFKNQLWKICQPKIIIVTGTPNNTLIKELDVDLVIEKPFAIDKFSDSVKSLLS